MQSLTVDDVARARVLMSRGRWDEASTVLGRLLVASPQSGSLWCLLAECRLGQRNWAAAAAAARSAIGLDREDVTAHLLASCAAGRRSRPDEALELARVAAEIAPSSWQAQAHLARLAAGRGGAVEAHRAASRAVAVAPDHPAARVAMGLVAHSRARTALTPAAEGASRGLDGVAAWLHDAGARYNLDRRGIMGVPPVRDPIAADPRWSSRPVPGAAHDDLPVVVCRLLARESYLLVLAACTVAWVSARTAPVIGLLAVAWYAAVVVHRLERPVRRGLARAFAGRSVPVAAGLLVAGVGMLGALALRPDTDDHRLVTTTVVAAVLVRLLMRLEARRTIELSLSAPAPYVLGSWVLWVLASALFTLAVVRLASAGDHDRVPSAVVGAGCLAAAVVTVAVIVHRFRVTRPAVVTDRVA